MSTRSPRSAVHGQAKRETVNLMCTRGNQIEKPVEYTTTLISANCLRKT
jgi:hypothetical protein